MCLFIFFGCSRENYKVNRYLAPVCCGAYKRPLATPTRCLRTWNHFWNGFTMFPAMYPIQEDRKNIALAVILMFSK